MKTKKHKNPSMVINVPVELAREIFSESGDLQSARFPAIMILADAIGKALPASHEECVKRPKPTILSKARKKKTSSKRPENYPFLTR